MNIKEIAIDSIKYPFWDWKKILILGFIVVIYKIPRYMYPFNLHNELTYPFLFIALLINFFISGYCFKIIQYSLKNTKELPKFRKWVNLFKNGFKVTLVSFIYSIPVTLPLIILKSSLLNFYANEPYLLIFIIDTIGQGYSYTICFAYILYLLILFPISLIAIANMANNDSKLSYAFEFKVIFDKIKNIGWIKFYSWYLLTSVIDLLIFLTGYLIITVLSIVIPTFPFGLINPLILAPYTYIFFYRSIALIYQSDNIT